MRLKFLYFFLILIFFAVSVKLLDLASAQVKTVKGIEEDLALQVDAHALPDKKLLSDKPGTISGMAASGPKNFDIKRQDNAQGGGENSLPLKINLAIDFNSGRISDHTSEQMPASAAWHNTPKALAGQPVLALIFDIAPSYYTYALQSDMSVPINLALSEGEDILPGPVYYPKPQLEKDSFSGEILPVYKGKISFFFPLPVNWERTYLNLKLLLCSRDRCIPLDMALPLKEIEQIPFNDDLRAGLQNAKATEIKPAALNLSSAQDGREHDFIFSPRFDFSTQNPTGLLSAIFIAFIAGLILNVMPCVLPVLALKLSSLLQNTDELTKAAYRARRPEIIEDNSKAKQETGLGDNLGANWGALKEADEGAAPVSGKAAGEGSGKGSGPDTGPNAASGAGVYGGTFREHNLFFALGIIISFTLLGICLNFFDFAWGEIFRYPQAIAIFAVLMCLLAFSALNLCTLPLIDLRPHFSSPIKSFGEKSKVPGAKFFWTKFFGAKSSARLGAFFLGLSATLLATPCSGPLMGGVLAYGIIYEPEAMFVIFFSMGLGMASPHVLFAIFPFMVRFLPKPGSWLFFLQTALGILLLITTVYLFSLLPYLYAIILASGLSFLAIILMWRKKIARLFFVLPLFVLFCLVFFIIEKNDPFISGQKIWEDFTAHEFGNILGKEPILLKFTADWCPNCKVLDMTTLKPDYLKSLQGRYNLRLIEVDMSLPDKVKDSFLRSLGSISLPLAAFFPAGDMARSPFVLRDMFGKKSLEAAIRAGQNTLKD